MYIYINFVCQCSMSKYIYKKIRHLLSGVISVSSKPSKTQRFESSKVWKKPKYNS